MPKNITMMTDHQKVRLLEGVKFDPRCMDCSKKIDTIAENYKVAIDMLLERVQELENNK